jgi:hypothetical protein
MNVTKTRSRVVVTLLCAGCAGSLLAATPDLSKLPPPSVRTGVNYAKDIKPLLDASCIRCHGADKPKAKLRLDSLDGVLKGGEDGKVIMPGKSKESRLVIAVSQLDDKLIMPPKPKGGPGGRGGPGKADGGDREASPGDPPASGARGNFGPPPKPLTPEQVGLVRAWIDQGAK